MITLVALSIVGATLHRSPNGNWVGLEMEGKPGKVVRMRNDLLESGEANFTLPDLKFKGQTFSAKGEAVVNVKTGDRLAIPRDNPPQYDGNYRPVFRFKSSVALKDTMLWCFAWDNADASMEPSFLVYAYEVGLVKGKLKLLRQSELSNFGGMGTQVMKVQGDLALFWAVGKVVKFDLKGWRILESWTGNVLSAPSGRTYMQLEKGSVLEWDKAGKWKEKSAPVDYIGNVYTLNGSDVFGGKGVLHNFDTKTSYSLPPSNGRFERSYQVIADQRYGLAVYWNYPAKDRKDGAGVLLDPRTLKPIITIKNPRGVRPDDDLGAAASSSATPASTSGTSAARAAASAVPVSRAVG